jgi:hypothetical protein
VKRDKAYFTIPKKIRIGKRMTAEEVKEAHKTNAHYLVEAQDDIGKDAELAFGEADMSLLDCLYFFEIITLDQYRQSSKIKTDLRDNLIVKGSWDEIKARKEEILTYNIADIVDLTFLAEKLTEEMQKVSEESHLYLCNGSIDINDSMDIPKIQENLGVWCARTAKYAVRGVPLNPDRMNTFLKFAPNFIQGAKEAWNRHHPNNSLYRVGFSSTTLSKRKTTLPRSPYIINPYIRDDELLQDMLKRYCQDNSIDNWPKTRTGKYAADSDTLGTYAMEGNLIKDLERHLGQLSSLKAFIPDKTGKIEALQYIDDNCWQHPDFNPHGTQTDRNGHKTKTYLLGASHWLRTLIDPPEGYNILNFDYASEEIFIAGVLYDDQTLMQAYQSSDFYMFTAQQQDVYPSNLPIPTEKQRKEEWFEPYKHIRSIYKPLCLSLQYGAGYKSCAIAIAQQTNQPVDFDKAREMVEEYHSTYSAMTQGTNRLKELYHDSKGITLQNGWRIGPNSKSILSAANVPIQGTGSCILQEACKRLDQDQIQIIGTMHDSITILCKSEYTEAIAEYTQQHMLDAAEYVLGKRGMKIGVPEIIHHGDFWVDEKGAKDWKQFKNYFCP